MHKISATELLLALILALLVAAAFSDSITF